MTFIDWFAGIGGFRRGMELAGHRCVGFCEFDKYATASYTAMHLMTEDQRESIKDLPKNKRVKETLKDEYRNGEWYAPDVRGVVGRDIPRADCWCFGFPCQDISVAGHMRGFEGERSSLFFRITELLRELEEEDRPTYLFIENVRNLLSVNRGFDFARLLVELASLGYDAEWEVLNSSDFGVPQNRERCFIIGHLRGRCTGEIFPLRRDVQPINIQEVGVEQIASMGGTYAINKSQPYRVYNKEGLAPTLGTMEGGGREPHIKVIGNTHPSGHGMNGQVYASNGLAPTLSTNKGEGSKIAIPCLTPDILEKKQNGRRFKDNNDPMFTLTAQDKQSVVLRNPAVLRSVRSEYGKEIRKGYENGEIDASWGEIKELEPRIDGVSNTLSTVTKDNLVQVAVNNTTKEGYLVAQEGDSINLALPDSKTRRDRIGKGVVNTMDTECSQGVIVSKYNGDMSQSQRIYSPEGVSPTLQAVCNSGLPKIDTNYRIRKLTPKECFRLQGWTDDYFAKAEFINSDSQLYKQAGNGVTVNVIYQIARRMEIKEDR